MTTLTRRQILTTLSLSTAALLSMSALAQEASFPSRPIRIIVPFSAGGVVDSTARIIAEKLGAKYGQPVIVENKTGAGGAIGTEFVAKSAPDGYTLLCVSPSHAVLPSLVKGLSWSPVRDFRAIQGIGIVPNLFVVHPSVPVKTMPELLALAKKSSEPLSYATAGVGTSNHLSGELLAQMAGVKLTHVPYRGQSDAMNDLLGGRVTMMPLTAAIAGPYVKTGKLRALAVTTARRSTAFPDLPTVAEAAKLPDYEVGTWFGLVAPTKVPDAVMRKLSADVAEILNMPEVKAKFATLGMELAPQSPAQFDAFIAAESTRWNKVLKQAGIEPQ
ncbi:tripartite tricarboxylate transporter substrate binding protein [Polaromonas sp. SM01]|uniref:Bug family tripartite tricarboxylate transporter substrate binding protein n=1 Tax=Polaromonas sp. SM01 TaxID=3085630 RepID=UPI002980DED5|nr:tripartite tricarboxylate transporter substrate binding protein [Polaromonas sp. SM01]MDW5443198.1 tripartite tricarboxylate transporter substrate binding protein [Polaromonas sp. SM01]